MLVFYIVRLALVLGVLLAYLCAGLLFYLSSKLQTEGEYFRAFEPPEGVQFYQHYRSSIFEERLTFDYLTALKDNEILSRFEKFASENGFKKCQMKTKDSMTEWGFYYVIDKNGMNEKIWQLEQTYKINDNTLAVLVINQPDIEGSVSKQTIFILSVNLNVPSFGGLVPSPGCDKLVN